VRAPARPQVPLIMVTELLHKRLKMDTLGNMIFWASFCVVGQPMCLILYYHDWLLANIGEQGLQQAAAQAIGPIAEALRAAAPSAAARQPHCADGVI
jgi:diacylglycerol O-acyltransferase-1